MEYVLALDQGTSSSRAIVFDERGGVCATAQREFAQHYPQPGWVEHDAEDIWQTQLAVAREAIWQIGEAATHLRAIGITNQRETTVLWERSTGRPVAPAIVWQDRRTAERCRRLREAGRAEDIRRRTGLELDAYFSATKLEWLLDHLPGARERAARGELAFGSIDSWLVWRLSGGRAHVTDVSNASRTMLFDIHRRMWDDTLLELFSIPPEVLPRVVPSAGVCGYSDADLLGLELPIAGMAGDQQAAAFGQACLQPGMAKNTYGTGCFMLLNTGDTPFESKHRLLGTVGWQLGARTTYMLEGSVFIAGALIQWLRDGLGIISRSSDIEVLAASVADSGGVSLVPAFAGLGAPYWDAYARGTLLGLTRGSSKAHIARAALEAIALQNLDVFQAMHADTGIALNELRVDGGASSNNLLMQIQADLLGVPVVRPQITETTALGAAYLAGLAVGVWRDTEEIAAHWQPERCFLPAIGADERTQRVAQWRRAVERARDWADHDPGA